MLHTTRPVNFSSRFDVVSCFVIYEDQFLLLHRQDDVKKQPDTWGLPAGKIEKGETPMQAMLREIREETGLMIPLVRMKQHHTLYVRGEYDFTYYIFHTVLIKEPEIILSPREHKAFAWVTQKEALKMKLIKDLDESIKVFFKQAK